MIRIATYNIKNGQGMDGKINLSRIAEVLGALQADCICLQEVDQYRPRSFLRNQAGDIARMLKMEYVFGPAVRYKIGSFGNAILSKYPITNTVNHQLPANKPERSMLEVHLDVDGELLRLFNTHMELNRRLRLQQIQNFIVPLIISSNSAAVFSGDLNETPDGQGITYLLQYLQDSYQVNSGELIATFRSDHPSERMDYILFNQACTAIDYKIIASEASDHLPVLACIDLQ